jgi:hypothetical protein
MSLQRSVARATALPALALCLCMPSPAAADHGTALLDERLAGYMSIAQTHWGGPIPTCVARGATVIAVHAVLYDDADPDVAARADQPGCRIWLDRSSWREMRPVEACMIVVHEWGHLLGLGHSHDPLDLMAAMPLRPPRGCRRVAGTPNRTRASAARGCERRLGRRARSGRVRVPRRSRHRSTSAPRRMCVRRRDLLV